MKKRWKQWTGLLCLVAMLVTSLPVSADCQIGKVDQQTIQVNPRYEELVSEEELFKEASKTFLQVGRTATAKPTYTTVEDAGAYLRGELVNREENVTFVFKTERADWDQIIDEVAQEAFRHTGVPTEGDYLAYQYAGYRVSASRSYDGQYYTCTYTFELSYYTSAEQEAYVTERVQAILDSLHLKNKSDYEKIRAIYDYVCQHVVYDYDHLDDSAYQLQYTAYAALKNGTCVCQGYANLMYRLLLEAGLDVRIVPGTSQGQNHAWNIVKIGDVYYNLDATWDAVRTDGYAYFLQGETDFPDHERNMTLFPDKYPMAKTAYVVGKSVDRVYGMTRFETSLAIADEIKLELGVEKFQTIILANGMNFPDALAGSYLAAKKQAPILMVSPTDNTKLYSYVVKNLKSGGQIYILGGKNAVPTAVESTLKRRGFKVKRLSGAGRYETNIKILEEAGVDDEPIIVCTGVNFADSLSASAAGLPILLVDPKGTSLSDEQKSFLKGKKTDIYIIGGESAVNKNYENLLKQYAKNGTVHRLSGSDRYVTSVKVADTFFGGGYQIVATYGGNFPDGLCGGPLAYFMGAPLILTTDAPEAWTKPAVQYVLTNHVTAGMALGGTSALSDVTVKKVFDLGKKDSITVKKYTE